jgi:hypothetical protein
MGANVHYCPSWMGAEIVRLIVVYAEGVIGALRLSFPAQRA